MHVTFSRIVAGDLQVCGVISQVLHVWQGQTVSAPIHITVAVIVWEIHTKSFVFERTFITQGERLNQGPNKSVFTFHVAVDGKLFLR